MQNHIRDIRMLTELIEAEAGGRPFDRSQARDLAHRLAEHNPEIAKTLRRISDRLGPQV
ncbi:hypothetical protein [Magnetospirillum sp. UT-4]|uniref:hypothetical protein n=1 Tax=Magnetospirillum sp. UT-4 TaxID=2681467 RepID=UPI00137EFB8E|nr:hypothetical protein [Magnetospirillum sp. UT-4]CAA7619805.1 conserved hypothetical protein [Magnetospirillum sp. UT-4]